MTDGEGTVATGARDEAAPDGAAPGEPVPATVEERHGAPVSWSRGQQVLHPTREQLVDLVRTLRDEDGFVMCVDVCGVDYLTHRAPRSLPDGVEPERFEVVVGLRGRDPHQRVRLRVQVPESDPTCPSLFEVHPGTEAMEREAFDLVGVRFEGHPDLTRILMPEDWEGHPLRKDYDVGRIPVQFKGVRDAR